MRIAIFGGTGFIGRYLTETLLEQKHTPVVLSRTGPGGVRASRGCEIVTGSVDDPDAIRNTIRQSDAVIYNIGILREIPEQGVTFRKLHFEAARRCMDTAIECGISRFILMSANGVRPDGTAYQKTKYMAEEYLATTDLKWTVFRPSVVFGDPGDKMEFATRLRNDIVNSPLPMPLFHDGLVPLNAGKFCLSPVHVIDVANAFANAIDMEETYCRNFPLGGPDSLDWKTILDIIARVSGRSRMAAPVPAWAVKLVAGFLDRYQWFPVTRDQISMLMEGNTCDSTNTLSMLGIELTPFNENTLAYLSL